MKILVVEDDFGSRKLMQKLLTSFGDLDLVVNGEEALDAFKMALSEDDPYDLVFMDIMLPKMDGHEALQNIRELEKEKGISSADEVKVIMATALEDPKNVIKAFNKGGATSYLVKPIVKEKLLEEMSKLGFYV